MVLVVFMGKSEQGLEQEGSFAHRGGKAGSFQPLTPPDLREQMENDFWMDRGSFLQAFKT